MQKQVFTGIIYPEFYTRCQNFRPLVSSWEVGIITCKILQVINEMYFYQTTHSVTTANCLEMQICRKLTVLKPLL